MPNTTYDVIIIGGGPAGLTAGLYASRSRLSTLLLEKMGCGGQSIITDWLENYPGFPDGIAGFDLAAKIEQQARKFGLNVSLEEATGLEVLSGGEKSVRTAGKEYRAPAVILAMGANHKKMGVSGEDEMRGRGVSYCATCDGPFFKDKKVAVVGGGNSAVQEALYLTRFAASVTLIHRRDRLRATKILQERAQANPKMRFMWNSVVTAVGGRERTENVTIQDVNSRKIEILPVEGVFVFIGLTPNTALVREMLKLDDVGYVLTDETMATSVPGVFACGDVRSKLLRQVVTATGEGAAAAFAAQEYVEGVQGIARH